jgi:hypothetical protein
VKRSGSQIVAYSAPTAERVNTTRVATVLCTQRWICRTAIERYQQNVLDNPVLGLCSEKLSTDVADCVHCHSIRLLITLDVQRLHQALCAALRVQGAVQAGCTQGGVYSRRAPSVIEHGVAWHKTTTVQHM